jgi:hypothetical protein
MEQMWRLFIKASRSYRRKAVLVYIYIYIYIHRGPLSLVRINEELLERKVATPV